MFGKLYSASAMALTGLVCMFPVRAQQVRFDYAGIPTDPVACEGVVYFGTEDGKLYAVRGTDGSVVPGFPVDLGVALGDGSYPSWRPSVYYGALGKAVYMQTSKAGVVKVWPDGRIAWTNKLGTTGTRGSAVAPAVTPDGDVIAEMKTSANVFVVKLKESDGTLLGMSPPLSASKDDGISSPAVSLSYIYTVVWSPPNKRDIIVLNQGDLTIRASLQGTGNDWSPPCVRESAIFIGCSASSYSAVSKFNSVTLAPDASFGTGGRVAFDTGGLGAYTEVAGSPRSANQDAEGTVYASIQSNNIAKVVAINAATGSSRTLFSDVNGALGAVVGSHNVVAYCSGNTVNLFSVDGGSMQSYTVAGTPDRPCYDPTTNRFFVTTYNPTDRTSRLLGFDNP